jgi:hypothetical protein
MGSVQAVMACRPERVVEEGSVEVVVVGEGGGERRVDRGDVGEKSPVEAKEASSAARALCQSMPGRPGG